MNSDFSDFIRFFPIFRLFPTFRLLDSTTLVETAAQPPKLDRSHSEPEGQVHWRHTCDVGCEGW